MKVGDLVKEKDVIAHAYNHKPRVGIIVRDDMMGFITVLWPERQRPIVTDPDDVYVISNNGGSKCE